MKEEENSQVEDHERGTRVQKSELQFQEEFGPMVYL